MLTQKAASLRTGAIVADLVNAVGINAEWFLKKLMKSQECRDLTFLLINEYNQYSAEEVKFSFRQIKALGITEHVAFMDKMFDHARGIRETVPTPAVLTVGGEVSSIVKKSFVERLIKVVPEEDAVISQQASADHKKTRKTVLVDKYAYWDTMTGGRPKLCFHQEGIDLLGTMPDDQVAVQITAEGQVPATSTITSLRRAEKIESYHHNKKKVA